MKYSCNEARPKIYHRRIVRNCMRKFGFSMLVTRKGGGILTKLNAQGLRIEQFSSQVDHASFSRSLKNKRIESWIWIVALKNGERLMCFVGGGGSQTRYSLLTYYLQIFNSNF